MKRGKKYTDSVKLYDKSKAYAQDEAIKLVLETSKTGFDPTIELHCRLGIDPQHADQQVRGVVVLPHGTGKTLRVLAIAKGAKADEAAAAGADIVGGDEIVQKIQGGWFDFDVCVTTPDMMGAVARLGRLLGPKGLMPTPKSGTVAVDIAKAIKDVKAGKVEYRADKLGNIHCPLGKASFGEEKILDNLSALMDAVIKAKPAAAKGAYLRSVSVSSAMGPGIKVNFKQ